MKVVIIHGTFGNPNKNWFPWLKAELENQGHKVWVPELPTPENQSLEKWCSSLINQVPFLFDEDTVLIGNSLGATYILSILDMVRTTPVKKTFLVSGFTRALGNEQIDVLNESFIKDFNWDRIKQNAGKVYVYQGEDDPYVPVSEGEKIAKELDGELIIIPNGGHLNSRAGFDKFDQLLEKI